MAGVKISQLQDGGALQPTDAFPVARGSFTRKIAGSELLTPIQNLNTKMDSLSSEVTSSLNSLSASTITMLVPTGAIMVFPSTIAPTGWLALSGQQVSRTTYSTLWSFAQSSGNIVTDTNWFSTSAIGSFSQGDGSTTFRIPDLRGEFVRGWDNGRGVDSGRTIGRWQVDEFKSHTHADSGAVGTYGTYGPNAGYATLQEDATGPAGGTETRPRNVALLYCIKF